MTKIISNAYRTDLSKTLYDDVIASDYYIVAADANTFSTALSNTEREFSYKLKSGIIFGKRVFSEGCRLMVKKVPWEANTVYQQYDGNIDLNNSSLDYYVTTSNENGDESYIFLCVDNNYASPSMTKPEYDESSITYSTSDGYIWRYICTVTNEQLSFYSTDNLIPLTSLNAPSASISTGLENIMVNNRQENKGYNYISDIEIIAKTGKTLTVVSDSLVDVNGYYVNHSLYFVNGGIQAEVRDIVSYTVVGSQKKITLKDDITNMDVLSPSVVTDLIPTLKVIGDGSGFLGIPKVSTDNKITKIDVVDPGQNYTRARAEILKPPFGNIKEAVLTPIISPENGYGHDHAKELNCNKVLLSAIFSEYDTQTLPQTNVYKRIGILKNPSFTGSGDVFAFDNRLVLTPNTAGDIPYEVGEVIYQEVDGERTAEAKVHEVSNGEIYIIEHDNEYSDFSLDYNIRGTINPIELPLNSIELPKYVPQSGDLLIASSFEEINRSENTSEQVKIIVDF